MKKKICVFVIGLMMILSLTSCVATVHATTQDDIYVEAYEDIVRSNVDFNIIIQNGTPYYYNGSVLYYTYNGLYYYPYYYNNYWYVRAYRKPFVHLNHKPYFRPHRYDYRFTPGTYRGYNRPPSVPSRPASRPNVTRPPYRPTQPNTNVRPPYRVTQPSRPPMRPSTPNRTTRGGSTRR